MTRHYEAVVVGGRLSAVVAAALLAKRGVRGLLVDDGELASEDPYLLVDSVPADADSAVMKLVHSELGLQDELRNRSEPLTPLLQIVWPDLRLDLSDDPATRLAELQRALGRQARGIDGFFERLDTAAKGVGDFLSSSGELPASGYFNRRSARSNARRYADVTQTLTDSNLLRDLEPEAVELFLSPLPFLTYIEDLTGERGSVARFARPLARFLAGPRTLRNGKSLRGLFAGVAERRAFEVQHGALEAAEPKGKQVLLRLSGQGDTITTDVMIDATGELSGLGVLPLHKRKRDLSEALQTARPKAMLHVLGIDLDDAVIPPGMGQHLLLLNGRRDPTRAEPEMADRAIWLTRRPAKQPGRTQLVVAHPFSAAWSHANGLTVLERMMKSRVERIVPFMAEGRPEVHTLSGSGGGTNQGRPVLPHPLFGPDLDPSTGLTGVPCRTSLKNVFVAGPAVLPGLGVEGEYYAALQAADACEALLRGTKPKRGLAQR